MKIRVAVSPGERRVAVLDRGGRLLDYAIDRPGAPDGVGDLYRGRVIAQVPAMAGAFVALDRAEGFLPDSEGARGLTAGTMLGVRITRAAQGGKGPRLTARLTEDERPPADSPAGLLRRGPDAIARFAGIHLGAPVLVDEPALAAGLREQLGPRVTAVPRAFDAELEDELDILAASVAPLPAGARLHIHPTPALTAIDIDAGTATAAPANKNAAQAALNRAVLPEVTRQIRLRNLSGAILIDLAGMPARRRATLGPAFIALLGDDPLQPRFLGFTALGLAEILRPRVHPPLHEVLAGPHAAGLAALRAAASRVAAEPAPKLVLRAAPAVIGALQDDAAALADLAGRAGRSLILRSDPGLLASAWFLEEVR